MVKCMNLIKKKKNGTKLICDMNILGISFILYEFAEFWRFDSGVLLGTSRGMYEIYINYNKLHAIRGSSFCYV